MTPTQQKRLCVEGIVVGDEVHVASLDLAPNYWASVIAICTQDGRKYHNGSPGVLVGLSSKVDACTYLMSLRDFGSYWAPQICTSHPFYCTSHPFYRFVYLREIAAIRKSKASTG